MLGSIIRLMGVAVLVISTGCIYADLDHPPNVSMVDGNNDELMVFESGQFGFRLEYVNDPHTTHTYLICGDYEDLLCAIDYDGVAFPYVVDREKVNFGEGWWFDGAQFEVVPEYIELPKRFSACSQLIWVRGEQANYSHHFVYSPACGVIGGCFDWGDGDICYWSSENQGLSLNANDYDRRDVLSDEQVRALHLGLINGDDRASFMLRRECLDDRRACPE